MRGCDSTMNAQIIVISPMSNVHPYPGISIIFISSLMPIMLIPLNKIHIPRNMGSIVVDIVKLKIRIKPSNISTIPLINIHILFVIMWCELVANARLDIPDTKMTMPIIDDKKRKLMLGLNIIRIPTTISIRPTIVIDHQNRIILLDDSKRFNNLFFIA